jgi:hypothetical protein
MKTMMNKIMRRKPMVKKEGKKERNKLGKEARQKR